MEVLVMILVKLKWGTLWPEAATTIATEQSAEIDQIHVVSRTVNNDESIDARHRSNYRGQAWGNLVTMECVVSSRCKL